MYPQMCDSCVSCYYYLCFYFFESFMTLVSEHDCIDGNNEERDGSIEVVNLRGSSVQSCSPVMLSIPSSPSLLLSFLVTSRLFDFTQGSSLLM